MGLWTIYIKTAVNELGFTRTIKASCLTEAEQNCLSEIKRYFKEMKHNLYLEYRGSGKYLIVSDRDEIGEVEIQQLKKTRVRNINEKSFCQSKDYYDTRLLSANPSDSE